MKLWASLYALTWLLFVDLWLGFTPLARPVTTYVHVALGIVIVLLAYSNAARLRQTRVPARVKRIARATFALSLFMGLLGVLIFYGVGSNWPVVYGITVLSGLLFLHFVNAVAMITQSAAAGLAYDMWEDREFERETRPGEVPRAPPPSSAPPTSQT
jgi:hypothetical protein